MAKIELSDDGTMDTVVRCSECGREYRFNWDGGTDADQPQRAHDTLAAYGAYVDECIAEIEAEHECGTD